MKVQPVYRRDPESNGDSNAVLELVDAETRATLGAISVSNSKDLPRCIEKLAKEQNVAEQEIASQLLRQLCSEDVIRPKWMEESPSDKDAPLSFNPHGHFHELGPELAKSYIEQFVVEGLLQRRRITLLASLYKLGKSTLFALILREMAKPEGGTLFGKKVEPGRAIVLTEESAEQWGERARVFSIPPGHHRVLDCGSLPVQSEENWRLVVAWIREQISSGNYDLIIIDTLSFWMHLRNENDNMEIASKLHHLLPLKSIENCPAIVILHHTRKYASGTDDSVQTSFRGGGQFGASVDNLFAMHRPTKSNSDSRRVITGVGRSDQLIDEIVIRYNFVAKEYTYEADSLQGVLEQDKEDEEAKRWQGIEKSILEHLPELESPTEENKNALRGVEFGSIREAVGKRVTDVRDTLKTLVAEGVVWKAKRGRSDVYGRFPEGQQEAGTETEPTRPRPTP